MISKFVSFKVEAEVCGQVRIVEWDADPGFFIVRGITSMLEAAELIQKLSSGGVAAFGDETIERMVGTSFPPLTEEPKKQAGPPPGTATIPIKQMKDKPPQVAQEVKTESPKESAPTAQPARSDTTQPSTTPPVVSSTPAPIGQPTNGASTSPPVGDTAKPGEDWRPFATFTRIGQIVDGLRQLVGQEANFDTIWIKALDIQAANACPAMNAAMQSHGGLGGLKVRLQTHCAAKKVAGAVPPATQPTA